MNPDIREYACEECGEGTITLRVYNSFAMGSCNRCHREFEFDVNDEELYSASIRADDSAKD